MADRQFPPLAQKMGKVVKAPFEAERGGRVFVEFGLSVPLSYEQNDTQWVNVRVYKDASKPRSLERAQQALALQKGDRVVVEGNYKETQGTDKTFYDLSAFALYRATEIKAEEDEDDL